jgi:hypothetical protein
MEGTSQPKECVAASLATAIVNKSGLAAKFASTNNESRKSSNLSTGTALPAVVHCVP